MSMDNNNSTGNLTDHNLEKVRWPGVVIFLYTTTYIFLYSFCLISILKDKELRKLPSYQIIMHIGLADLSQLVMTLFGGIFSVCQTDFHFVLNKIQGGVLISSWIAYTAMADLLAWNRLIYIYNPGKAIHIFTLRNTRIMLAICWIYGLIWLTVYMCPNYDFIYTPADHTWDYTLSPQSVSIGRGELSQDVFHCTSMVLCYGAIFFELTKQVRKFFCFHRSSSAI